MERLHKAISKYTGNICMAGSTEAADYVFEAKRTSKTIDYVVSNALVEGICYENFSAGYDCYLITYGTSFVGQYTNGSIIPNYINISPNYIHNIVRGNNEYGVEMFYGLDRVNNRLIKFSYPYVSEEWKIELPINIVVNNSNLYFRQSNSTIVVHNSDTICVIRDDLTSATLIDSIIIGGTSRLNVNVSGEFRSAFTHIRYRQVSGSEIEQSTSTSSSSSIDSSSSSSQ